MFGRLSVQIIIERLTFSIANRADYFEALAEHVNKKQKTDDSSRVIESDVDVPDEP